MTNRPHEIEQWSNSRLVHPVSERVAQWAMSVGLSANTVSVAGLLSLAAAGALFALSTWPFGAFAGAVLVFISHVFDGADGMVARHAGTPSPYGEVIDGVCDYLGYAILYAAVWYLLLQQMDWKTASVIIIIAAISHVFQVNHYETRRRRYCHRVYGMPWLGSEDGRLPLRTGNNGIAWYYYYPTNLYVGTSNWLNRENDEIIETLGRLGSPSGWKEFNEISVTRIKQKAILSQNTKSAILSVAMIAQCPLCYVVFVGVVLNLALLFFRICERREDRMLAAKLQGGSCPT